MSRPARRPEEIAIGEPTRKSPLHWVVIVDAALSQGEAANAVACVAANAGQTVAGLIGPGGPDADAHAHPGRAWAGCTILAAPAELLTELRRKAAAAGDVALWTCRPASRPTACTPPTSRSSPATTTGALQLRALSLFGPNRISKLTGKLALLQ